MASTRREKRVVPSTKNNKSPLVWIKKASSSLNLPYLLSFLTDPKKIAFIAGVFVVLEIALNILVIHNVPYTEIDWRAYMQEVEGFINGTWDYSKLKGDTGPLVYPAGFVYAYSLLYYVTSHGQDIRSGQYVFALLYIVLLIQVLRIYAKTKKVPPYVLILIFCTSYRVHSIFVLRLFNDSLAMIFLFASLNAFLDDRWYWGSINFSLAVSMKMNILLFSPALFIAYLCNLGIFKTIVQLGICGVVQLILGLPFLITNPYAYIAGAFNFARVFDYKWTVNWRIIPEELFVKPTFHMALLGLHLACIVYFIPSWMTYMKCYAKLKAMGRELKPQMKNKNTQVNMSSVSQLFISPLFTANFLGIIFSRSLHYQFYLWYYHTLPYIAWSTHYLPVTRIVILGLIELCWNVYPSTVWSSAMLHICHLMLLYGLYRNKVKNTKFD
ncbi:lethal(2)neighbour of Tid protein [Microplitis mediator]|uniref:lethal(2)neighbour of Tid protein n=1 Tax=Microplitis mediator TaxID=375433 RepID=UPI002556D6D9|nr:lethal(2)neighbour of Tid protein [Microplitis mediator]